MKKVEIIQIKARIADLKKVKNACQKLKKNADKQSCTSTLESKIRDLQFDLKSSNEILLDLEKAA